MRWKPNEKHKRPPSPTNLVFAYLPTKCVDGTWVWWERVYVTETKVYDRDMGMFIAQLTYTPYEETEDDYENWRGL